MGKLGRRFRRELAASPKKAAVLGLLALVALYYWAPLVRGWVFKNDDKGDAKLAATASPTPTATNPTATPTKTDVSQLPWQQVVKLMESDPRTLAADATALRRDPFLLPKPDGAKLQAEAEAAAKADAGQSQAAVATPQSLGLTLSSTIIGQGRRLARISGRTYEQGQAIRVLKDGQTVAFTLAEVHARRVVLTREKNKYELTIPDPLQSKKIEVSQSGG
jgi:hypothetical protein